MATQNTTRKPQQRRKKKKNSNEYLYVAISLGFIALILFTLIMCIVTGCGSEEESDTPDNSSVSPAVSSEQESTPESSKDEIIQSSLPDDSSDESLDESESVSSEPENGSSEKTQQYEEYIGTEYAIDMTDYEQYVCPENADKFVFIVNPSHPLSSDYVPEDLVWCTNIRAGRPEAWSYMDRTANYALEAFLKEAAYYGFDDITVTNAYRSYNSQASLFSGYVAGDMEADYYCDTCAKYFDTGYVAVEGGICPDCGSACRRPTEAEATTHVLTYSTRPGTSEHQSGLCCDMHNLPSTTSAFDNTPEAKWLAANAHRFGFILRYPPNTQHITGIKHESWHFRFVGRDAATEIYEQGITLDEYLA